MKESLIKEIFQDSIEQIQKLRQSKDKKYFDSLSKIIISSGISLGGGELEMQINPDDISMVNISILESEIANKIGSETILKIMPTKNDTINGGVILYKGSLSVNNSLNAILERRSEIIRNRLNKMVFDELEST